MGKIKKFNESTIDASIYIKSVELVKDITPLKSGVHIEFTKPITFIVGDNGVGKSTLLECIRKHYGSKSRNYMSRQMPNDVIKIEDIGSNFNFTYIDFHGDDLKFATNFVDDFMIQQLQQMKASSGQVSISLLNDSLKDINKVKNGVVILDEPCRGQSIKNKWKLVRLIHGLTNNFGCQVILTTHSDTILSAFKNLAQYYDIESNSDITYKDFIISQLR